MTSRDTAIAAVDAYAADAAAQATAAGQASLATLQGQLATAQQALATETAAEHADQTTIAGLNATIKQLEAQLATHGARFPGDVGAKVYGYSYGTKAANDTGDGTPGPVITETGLVPAAFRKYFENTVTPATITAAASALVHQGIYPVTSQKLPNDDWQAAGNGASDGWITDRLAALAATGKPALIAPHHEPENDVNGGTRTSQTFDAMVRRYRKIIDTNGFDIALAICLMGGHYNPNTKSAKANPKDWTTSIDVIDVLLLDQYVQWSPTGGGQQMTPQQAHGDLYAVFAPIIGDLPWGIAEHGIRDDPTKPGWSSKWMTDDAALLDELEAIFQLYFNSDRNSPDGSWAIHKGSERYAPFTSLIQASPRILAAAA